MSRILLVSIAIGESYLHEYNTLFRPSHELYAKRHGYDFKVVSEWIKGPHVRDSTSFQKILIPGYFTDYDYVIFVDADILIHPEAPPIHLEIESEGIGCVDQWAQPDGRRLEIARRYGWETSAIDYYKLAGFTINIDKVINTGVLVFQPALHANICNEIYRNYVNNCVGNRRGFHYEQSAIGYTLQSRDLVKWLDSCWNAIWPLNNAVGKDLLNFCNENWFIHFAGGCDWAKVPKIWSQLNTKI
jgi:lipopolysaccharide biosynthesis glycosyltransferase